MKRLAIVLCASTFFASAAHAQTRIAALADIGGDAPATQVADIVKPWNPTAILMAGDLCYGSGSLATQIGKNYGTVKAKIKPALGNHEFSDPCGGTNASNYKSYFTLPNNERYYDITIGNVYIASINSNAPATGGNSREPDGSGPTSKQANWFKPRVAASNARWKIAEFHHPAFSSGQHGSSVKMRWPFEAWGFDLVIMAHDHHAERILRDDNGDGRKLTYIIAGLGGSSGRSIPGNIEGSVFKFTGKPGAWFLIANDTTLTAEFRTVDGIVRDSFTLTKSASSLSAADAEEEMAVDEQDNPVTDAVDTGIGVLDRIEVVRDIGEDLFRNRDRDGVNPVTQEEDASVGSVAEPAADSGDSAPIARPKVVRPKAKTPHHARDKAKPERKKKAEKKKQNKRKQRKQKDDNNE